MPRINNAILPQNIAYARGQQNPMIDIRFGGQMGYAPDLTEWVSNQAYVRRNLICLLVEAPTGFQNLPDSDYWTGTLRALVELHPQRIQGLNATLNVEFTETPVGGAGQIQHDVTDVKETPPNISFTWKEKYGMPIQRFFSGWIRYLMMDPNSKFASINTISGNAVPDMLSDRTSATMLFIEPDPTHTKVVKSWLVSNMMPKSSGEVVGTRDITAAGEPAEYEIEMTGISQYGTAVDAFAQRVLSGISITGADPYNRAAMVSSIDPDVLAQQKSYGGNISELASTALAV